MFKGFHLAFVIKLDYWQNLILTNSVTAVLLFYGSLCDLHVQVHLLTDQGQ